MKGGSPKCARIPESIDPDKRFREYNREGKGCTGGCNQDCVAITGAHSEELHISCAEKHMECGKYKR